MTEDPPPTTGWNGAILAAAVPDRTQPVPALTPIRTPKVRLVTWKRAGSEAPSPGAHHFGRPVWATVDGELQAFCHLYVAETHASGDALRARVEKLLGLPDGDEAGRVVVTFSVDAAQVFRPCPDPAIDTTTCPVTLEENAMKSALDKDPAAARFLLEHMLASYVQRDGYPFVAFSFKWDSGPRHQL